MGEIHRECKRARGLGPLDLEVVHKGGRTLLDPNAWTVAIVNHYTSKAPLKVMLPIDGLKSVISGEPAVLFRTTERDGGLEIALTTSELVRYIGLDLFPNEFEALVRLYGDHYQIHDVL